jgi:ATP-binding cassette subfamily B protein
MNPEPSRPMGRLFRYLGNYRLRLSWSVFHAIANKLFDLMPPIMVGGWLIKSLEGSPPEWLWTDDVWQQVLIICGLIVLVFFAESFFEWRFQLGFRGLAQQVQHDLRSRCLRPPPASGDRLFRKEPYRQPHGHAQ